MVPVDIPKDYFTKIACVFFFQAKEKGNKILKV